MENTDIILPWLQVTTVSRYIFYCIYIFLFQIRITWVIVVFDESKDYCVVPTNWLIQNNTNNLLNKTVQLCYWPLGRVTSTEIQDASKPDESWYTYKIKVHGGNKTYGIKNALLCNLILHIRIY